MPSEFDLIRRFFTRPAPHAVLGVGDDAALVKPVAGKELAVSTDMLVAGKHFFHDDDPCKLGQKSLAVNLSDMAAMGAKPRWATLALALPDADEEWLRGFASGFFDMAGSFGVDLIGGDTTRGPLAICVQIIGEAPAGKALRRTGAKSGDDIWVSGHLGDAALALAHRQRRIELAPHEAAACLPYLHMPQPRVALGEKLRALAHGAIDISDGLLADLGHILAASGVAADIEFTSLPISETMRKYLDNEVARTCLLVGGDDYELCFTATPERRAEILALARRLKTPLTRIGVIKSGRALRVLDAAGKRIEIKVTGFDHFA